jgi:serralysin
MARPGYNSIVGTDGNDTLYGSTGDDWMEGLSGLDLFVSSQGQDYMEGGRGADTFRFRNLSEASGDHIIRFEGRYNSGGANGEGDWIDLSAIDAKEGYTWSTWGNQAFTWRGDISYSSTPLGRGELGYVNKAYGITEFYGNTDSDSSYELYFAVSGYSIFTRSDFLL